MNVFKFTSYYLAGILGILLGVIWSYPRPFKIIGSCECKKGLKGLTTLPQIKV